MTFTQHYFERVAAIAQQLDYEAIERLVAELVALRDRGGRLFLLGVAGIEAYTPTDNVSELTARVNDEGWETVFSEWLRGSRANERDAILVFSVGGGDAQRNVSPNIVRALDEARARGLRIFGIVGRDGGYTRQVGDVVVIVPTVDAALVTPFSESFQAVVWHCLVSHPAVARAQTKWESVAAR